MGGAVKKVAQVAIGAAVGFATGGFAGAIIGGAAAAFANKGMNKPSLGGSDTQPSAQTVRSSKAPCRYILGRQATGGVLIFAQEEKGDQDEDEKLHLVYMLSEGSIAGVDEVYLDQRPIGEYDNLASYQVHINRTTADPYLLENCPDWKSTMIGRGCSYLRLTLTYDREEFTSIPDAQFIVRGRTDIFDPRTGKTGYSENTALHILWVLRNRCNVPDDEIVMDTFKTSANICMEYVTDPDGNSRPRYATGAVIGADEKRFDVIESLEASCAGNLIMVGGRWSLQVGAYYGPADFTIDEDMVVGGIEGSTETSNADAVNTITGTFTDPEQVWAETDYPQVQVDDWVSEDGGESSETLALPYVTSAYQAQRLANIKLRQKRASGALSMMLNFKGYECRPGRVVHVDLPSININGEFVVSEWQMGTEQGCDVALIQTDEEIYDDAVGKPYSPDGFINLPSGGMASPTGLYWELRRNGGSVQGVLGWNQPGSANAFSVVVYNDQQRAVFAAQVPGEARICNIGGLPAGNYVAGVRAIGSFGRSGEATITLNINQPAPPDRIVTAESRDTVMLIPILDAGLPSGTTWEYYWSTNADIADGEVEGRATYLSQGASVTHTGLVPGETYTYWVRGINAYGRSIFVRQQVTTSQNFDDIWAALAQEIEREGGLYESIVNGVTPGVIGQIDTDLSDVREQLANDGMAISELEQSSQEMTLKMLLLKAAGESNNSTIRVEQIVRADIARQLTVVQLDQARVSDDLYAMWDPESGFTARAVRMVQVGDNKAVLGLQADGETSEIGAVAGRFYVVNEVSGESVTAFVVEDGRVVMPEALISTVSIEKLRTLDGKTVIEGGKIRTELIDVDSIKANELVSKVNGFNGRPTFALRENGTFEFNSPGSGGGTRFDGRTQFVYNDNGGIAVEIGYLS